MSLCVHDCVHGSLSLSIHVSVNTQVYRCLCEHVPLCVCLHQGVCWVPVFVIRVSLYKPEASAPAPPAFSPGERCQWDTLPGQLSHSPLASAWQGGVLAGTLSSS